MATLTFIEVTPKNISEEGLFCVRNPKNPGFQLKSEWLEKRRSEGLILKLLKAGHETVGFIEYVPGEFAWRPVAAKGYIFIHCLWIYPKKNLKKGYASRLIQHCLEESRKAGWAGVAVITSEGSWMAGKELFLKNGFTEISSKGRFDLLAIKFKEMADPTFMDWESKAKKYQGLNLIYAHQCPLFIKSVEDITARAKGYELELKITELKTAKDAQNSPSGYGVYSLIYNGKLVADHYISNTRFRNILNKELKS
jgi:L-amino acid N-acyltransferase YncA